MYEHFGFNTVFEKISDTEVCPSFPAQERWDGVYNYPPFERPSDLCCAKGFAKRIWKK
jgi:hypothetical protein